jgi:hypothetical protein
LTSTARPPANRTRSGAGNTPLALYAGVDFRVETVHTLLDEP